MVKLAIFEAEDSQGAKTGFVICPEDDDTIYSECDTREEAEGELPTLQAEIDLDDKLKAEYLEWETACLQRHGVDQERLRVFLVNSVMV